MFSSCGYFRGVVCPFFSNGLCERPFCHFKHAICEDTAKRSDVVQLSHTQDLTPATSSVEYRPTPLHLLKSTAVNNLQEYDPLVSSQSSTKVSTYACSNTCSAAAVNCGDKAIPMTSLHEIQATLQPSHAVMTATYEVTPVDSIPSNAILCFPEGHKKDDGSLCATDKDLSSNFDDGVVNQSDEKFRTKSLAFSSYADHFGDKRRNHAQSNTRVTVIEQNFSNCSKQMLDSCRSKSCSKIDCSTCHRGDSQSQCRQWSSSSIHCELPSHSDSSSSQSAKDLSQSSACFKKLRDCGEVSNTGAGHSSTYNKHGSRNKSAHHLDGARNKTFSSVGGVEKSPSAGSKFSSGGGMEISGKQSGRLSGSSEHENKKKSAVGLGLAVCQDYVKKSTKLENTSPSIVGESSERLSPIGKGHSTHHDRPKVTSERGSGDNSATFVSEGRGVCDIKSATSKKQQLPVSSERKQSFGKSSGQSNDKLQVVVPKQDSKNSKINNSKSPSQHSTLGYKQLKSSRHKSDVGRCSPVDGEKKSENSRKTSSKHHIHDKQRECGSSDVNSKKQFVRPTTVDLFGEDSDTESTSVSTKSAAVSDTDTSRQSRVELEQKRTCDSTEDATSEGYDECYQTNDELLNEQSSSISSQLNLKARPSLRVASAAKTPQESTNRKRIAHTPFIAATQRKVPAEKKPRLSLGQQMLERYKTVETQLKLDRQKSNESDSAKNTLESASMMSVTQKRIAHTPKVTTLNKPTLPPDSGSKIPLTVRQFYLGRFFADCVKLYDLHDDAVQRSLSEEKSVYERSSTKSIYTNLAINTIRRLRDELPHTSTPRQSKTVFSHEAVLGGSKAAYTSYTVNRCGKLPEVPEKFSDAMMYERLEKYLLQEDELTLHGYPRPVADNPGSVTISIPQLNRNQSVPQSSNANERVCCRCGKKFIMLPDGTIPIKENCTYHWGKAWKKRVAGSIENIYTCCQGDFNAVGCQISPCHVHEHNKYADLCGYVKTLPIAPHRTSPGVYAIDCEMVYTTAGSELARVTVINSNLERCYDTLVRPDHPILDCNTRFSGITEEELNAAATTLRDVQDMLLALFNENSIVIGHSLESDFVALKIIHSTVVDTAVVFPHRLGLPYKRALKTLAAEKLQRIIQNDVGGHDSAEDAKTCMELMIWQLKEEVRRELRR